MGLFFREADQNIQFVALGLGDLVHPAADQLLGQLALQTAQHNAVHRHGFFLRIIVLPLYYSGFGDGL